MTIIRLTVAAWLAHECERVRGVLLMTLTRSDMDVDLLLQLLVSEGLIYTPEELQLIGAQLVADGVIEII